MFWCGVPYVSPPRVLPFTYPLFVGETWAKPSHAPQKSLDVIPHGQGRLAFANPTNISKTVELVDGQSLNWTLGYYQVRLESHTTSLHPSHSPPSLTLPLPLTLSLTPITHPHHSPSPLTPTTHPHHSPPPLTLTTHPHHSPPPLTPTTHPHHSPSPLTPTTHPHHSPPPLTPTTHPHHSPPPLTLTTHPHHSPPPLTPTTHPHHSPPPLTIPSVSVLPIPSCGEPHSVY